MLSCQVGQIYDLHLWDIVLSKHLAGISRSQVLKLWHSYSCSILVWELPCSRGMCQDPKVKRKRWFRIEQQLGNIWSHTWREGFWCICMLEATNILAAPKAVFQQVKNFAFLSGWRHWSLKSCASDNDCLVCSDLCPVWFSPTLWSSVNQSPPDFSSYWITEVMGEPFICLFVFQSGFQSRLGFFIQGTIVRSH